MAKRVRLSADDVTYHTLPGNSAELRNEAGELTDTIFGQSFESSETGLIGWSLTSNALYKGFAGYVVLMKKSGTSTAMTDEATTQVGATKTYIVTATTKQVLDPAVAIVVEDNAVAVAASNIESINYLTGEVTFVSSYTPTGPVTITGNYLPMTEIAGTRDFTLGMTTSPIDDTDIPTARANDGFRTFDPGGLKTVSLDIGGVYKGTNAFAAALRARDPIFVEINPDGQGRSVARGMFKYTSQSQSGDVGALEEESVTLRLNVPEGEKWTTAFSWNDSGASTLSQAVRLAIAAFINSTSIYVEYLHDGTNGHKGEAVISDVSLSGGLEAMNEFSIGLQGSGAPTPVP